MSSVQPSLDAAGRRRSPATTPGFRTGIAPRNKGQRYPADPPTVDEIVAVMRQAGRDRHGHRLSALIVVLWRAGLRINEALSLTETDLDQGRGSILVRHGLCRVRHNPAYAEDLLMPSVACTDRVVPAQVKIDDHRTRHNHRRREHHLQSSGWQPPVEGCVVQDARRWAAWAQNARWVGVSRPRPSSTASAPRCPGVCDLRS
jgi:integrase